MDTQLPQVPEPMDYDELAYQNLRTYFPLGKFNISKVETVFGSREFGKDWIIEKLDEKRRNTGIEFFVQSKTTGIGEKDEFISLSLETKNINYLAAKTEPVFIHLYQRDTKIGYWLWFQEWYYTHFSSGWASNQGSATIRMPTSQILSEQGSERIMQIVTDDNFRARVRQAVDLYNRYNPDFHFSPPEIDKNNVFSIAYPKRDGAQFTFMVDEVGNEAIRRALEEGHTVEFPVLNHDMQSPFEFIREPDGKQIMTIIPAVSSEVLFHLNVCFYDDTGVIYEDENVPFHAVRFGSKEREFRGEPHEQPITYIMIWHFQDDQSNPQGSFHFHCTDVNDPLKIRRYVEIYDIIRASRLLILTNSANGKQIALLEMYSLPEILEAERRFINAMYDLKTQKDISLVFPSGKISPDLIYAVELSRDILIFGKSRWVNEQKGARKVPIHQAMQIIERFEQDGHVLVTNKDADFIEVEIMGTKIAVGMVRDVYFVTNIHDLETIKAQIGNLPQDETTVIMMEFDIDMTQSFSEKE